MTLYRHAKEIVQKLAFRGFTAYFAGGWVRDFILNRPSDDIDIATNASPQEILDLFPNTILVGLSFGIVIVVTEGHQFEVATFRRDLHYSGGRRPEGIELSTPREDAARRDFTINGMFYDPLEDEIYDYVGGMEDLHKGVIRTIGDPHERFFEDRLRMIRAVRFACKFSFYIDPETEEGIRANAHTLFPAVAAERIWQELNKMAADAHFDQAVITLHRMKLLREIFPGPGNLPHNRIKRLMSPYAYCQKNAPPVLYVMLLFPNASLEEIFDVCRQLKMSKKEERIAQLADQCRLLVDNEDAISPHEWVRFYAQDHASIVCEIDAAARCGEEKEDLLRRHEMRRLLYRGHIQRCSEKKKIITSTLLRNEGILPGKRMGLLIDEGEHIAVAEDLSEAQEVLHRLKLSPLWPT